MTSIVITPKDRSELNRISNYLKRRKIVASIISDDSKEDLGLKILMKEAERTKTVSKRTIMKKLKNK
jgi:hypothetical protein